LRLLERQDVESKRGSLVVQTRSRGQRSLERQVNVR
jgi:hypothetical protein